MKADTKTVNRVRRAVMSEIDRRSAASVRLLGPLTAARYLAALNDFAGWLEDADVGELLGPDDSQHARSKR